MLSLKTIQFDAQTMTMQTWSSEDLVIWVNGHRQHCEDALSVLIGRHQDWIYKRSLYRLANTQDAEDVTQDIIMRVRNRLHQFRGRSLFKTWLTTIIDNYCYTYAVRRSRYTHCDHIEQLIELQQYHEINDPYAEMAEHEQIYLALGALSEHAKQVISLRFFAEYSLEEIANLLSLSLSATKARLYRALEQLKIIYLNLNNARLPLTSLGV